MICNKKVFFKKFCPKKKKKLGEKKKKNCRKKKSRHIKIPKLDDLQNKSVAQKNGKKN